MPALVDLLWPSNSISRSCLSELRVNLKPYKGSHLLFYIYLSEEADFVILILNEFRNKMFHSLPEKSRFLIGIKIEYILMKQ